MSKFWPCLGPLSAGAVKGVKVWGASLSESVKFPPTSSVQRPHPSKFRHLRGPCQIVKFLEGLGPLLQYPGPLRCRDKRGYGAWGSRDGEGSRGTGDLRPVLGWERKKQFTPPPSISLSPRQIRIYNVATTSTRCTLFLYLYLTLPYRCTLDSLRHTSSALLYQYATSLRYRR